MPVPAGPKKKPKDHAGAEITKAQPAPLYVWRRLLNADEVIAWAKEQGFDTCLPPEQMHVTITYSKQPVDWMAMGESWSYGGEDGKLIVPAGGPRMVSRFNEGAVVLQFASSDLSYRNMRMREEGASYDWPEYLPHITLTYKGEGVDLSKVTPFAGKLEFGPEIFEEIKGGFDPGSIVEKIEKQDGALTFCKVAGVNEELGLVFGWSIVCKVKGEDYYDLNIEKNARGEWVKVPEHITETAMVKGAADFAKSERPGNEMHAGPDSGQYVFLMPWTAEIAKAYGYDGQPPVTGLMVAYHPTPDVLAKFKSGDYTGFSIEGSRLRYEEMQ